MADMNWLKDLAEIPVDTLTRWIGLAIIAATAVQFLPFTQEVIAFLLNMGSTP